MPKALTHNHGQTVRSQLAKEECVCTRRVLLCEKCGLRARAGAREGRGRKKGTLEWLRVSPSRWLRSTPSRLFSCSVIVWVGLRQWLPFIAGYWPAPPQCGRRMKDEEKICEFGQVDDGRETEREKKEAGGSKTMWEWGGFRDLIVKAIADTLA